MDDFPTHHPQHLHSLSLRHVDFSPSFLPFPTSCHCLLLRRFWPAASIVSLLSGRRAKPESVKILTPTPRSTVIEVSYWWLSPSRPSLLPLPFNLSTSWLSLGRTQCRSFQDGI